MLSPEQESAVFTHLMENCPCFVALIKTLTVDGTTKEECELAGLDWELVQAWKQLLRQPSEQQRTFHRQDVVAQHIKLVQEHFKKEFAVVYANAVHVGKNEALQDLNLYAMKIAQLVQENKELTEAIHALTVQADEKAQVRIHASHATHAAQSHSTMSAAHRTTTGRSHTPSPRFIPSSRRLSMPCKRCTHSHSSSDAASSRQVIGLNSSTSRRSHTVIRGQNCRVWP